MFNNVNGLILETLFLDCLGDLLADKNSLYISEVYRNDLYTWYSAWYLFITYIASIYYCFFREKVLISSGVKYFISDDFTSFIFH